MTLSIFSSKRGGFFYNNSRRKLFNIFTLNLDLWLATTVQAESTNEFLSLSLPAAVESVTLHIISSSISAAHFKPIMHLAKGTDHWPQVTIF